MASDTQILKGLLEGCILKIVKENETYGYEICELLMNYGFADITEGSVYPILIRLEKKKLIYSVMKNSPFGPKRKYYYLTTEGSDELEAFVISWNDVKTNVDRVLGG
ncbi:PadR family transcriptional regulator [Clostridium sp. CS001]|uniref:PadR family transcriptional regulator n=1 Tax=Clostridium sp. CS001 TaxID=2880648 RepID=UPI001CF3C56F|nr:PadR family transcriptional regulator [Clostridium sp. CS001]MCB2289359.1 PadR family transcriptional regulator [Clostridium sp. CS001]